MRSRRSEVGGARATNRALIATEVYSCTSKRPPRPPEAVSHMVRAHSDSCSVYRGLVYERNRRRRQAFANSSPIKSLS
jgi:hypothetical protein